MDPKNASALATLTTAVVVPVAVTMVPMHIDSINCAKKTILDTSATSVPRPRIWLETFPSPSWVVSNCQKNS